MRIELDRQENPYRGRDLAEAPRFPDNARPGKTLRCQLSQGFLTVGRAGKNRNGKPREDRLPIAPMPDLCEIVGAHQPDETEPRPATLKRRQRVGGEMRPESLLEIEHADAPIGRGQCLGAGETIGKLAHAGDRLQRILRRHQPPDLVEAEPLQRLAADMEMALMRRVERAAEQADAPLRQMAEAGDAT